jgi:hypothetical protein
MPNSEILPADPTSATIWDDQSKSNFREEYFGILCQPDAPHLFSTSSYGSFWPSWPSAGSADLPLLASHFPRNAKPRASARTAPASLAVMRRSR